MSGSENRMTTYHIEVQSISRAYASAYGDLDTINYIAKKVAKEIEGDGGLIELTLNETDSVLGQTTREVVKLSASAKIVTTVLKGELATERKAAKTAPTESGRPSLEDLADPVGGGEGYLGEYDGRAVN